MDAEGEILEDGLMFTVFEEGPWAGFKFPGDPSMGWVSGGKDHYELMVTALNVDLSERYLVQIYVFDPQVWRHSCMSLSRTTGKFKLVENGNVALEKYTNETYNYLQKIPFAVSITYVLDL